MHMIELALRPKHLVEYALYNDNSHFCRPTDRPLPLADRASHIWYRCVCFFGMKKWAHICVTFMALEHLLMQNRLNTEPNQSSRSSESLHATTKTKYRCNIHANNLNLNHSRAHTHTRVYRAYQYHMFSFKLVHYHCMQLKLNLRSIWLPVLNSSFKLPEWFFICEFISYRF